MRKYKIELTGHIHHFTITDEEGNVFSVIRFYNGNNHSINWKIMDRYCKDVEGERLRGEIIYTILKEEERKI